MAKAAAGAPPSSGGRSARRGALAIRGRLYLAFAMVASLTVLASAIGVASYGQLGGIIQHITAANLPAMAQSLHLAKASAEISTAAPTLLAARDAAERTAAVATLNAQIAAVGAAVDGLAGAGGHDDAVAALRQTAGDLAANLTALAALVERRQDLTARRAAALAALAGAHRALDAKLAPLLDDAAFDLATGLESATDAGDIKAIGTQLTALADQQLGAVTAMYELRADSNLVFGLLGEAAGVPSKDLLVPIRDRFTAAADHMAKSLQALKGAPAGDALRDPIGALLGLGRGDASLFALRHEELEAAAAAETKLVLHRRLADALGQDVTQLVAASDGEARQSAARAAAATSRGRLMLIAIAAASLVSAAVIAWRYVGRTIVGRLIRLRRSMMEIAAGNLDAEIAQAGGDEIADMAAALMVFRDNGRAARDAEERAAAERRQQAAQRRTELLALADQFESSFRELVETMSLSAREMTQAAAGLVGTAGETSRQTAAAAAASRQAASNVETAAAATEALSSSTAEIDGRAAESATVANRAVDEAAQTQATMRTLSDAARNVGDVVKLISDIAEQTNLLALNATIEAARAGPAGQGFAVVANEVKTLASQTGRATDEIGAQIRAIQDATGRAVTAIDHIGATIRQVSDNAATIAGAAGRQDATTRDIAIHVAEAAKGSESASGSLASVADAAEDTGEAAKVVLDSARGLSDRADRLRAEVDRFLDRVRAA